MGHASPAIGYSLPVGDAVSLALTGALLAVLAAFVYVFWTRRTREDDRAQTRTHDRESGPVTPGRGDKRLPEAGHSDEELIRRWLSEAGGELPQKAFTERSGWSKSKVSRLLSRMEDEGTIEKVSVGRENVIVLLDDPNSP